MRETPAKLSAMLLACVLIGGFAKAGNAPLDKLRKLTPAERQRILANVLKKNDLHAATRGLVTLTLIERGSLEAVHKTDVICQVRGAELFRGPMVSPFATVIRWVVDDGANVRKGDKLIEFDDANFKDELKAQKGRVARAEAGLSKVKEHLVRVEKDNGIGIKLAEIEVRLAELAVKAKKANDPIQTEILELQVLKNRLLLDRVKSHAEINVRAAQTERDVKATAVAKELARLHDIEANIARCVVVAPQDGMVAYYVPTRAGNTQEPIVAQGEPVRTGQKLLVVSDLKAFTVQTFISESAISKVRVDQKASIRVDAYPGQVYAGKVQQIAKHASSSHWFHSNIKVYQVGVGITGTTARLRPGMSAEVATHLEERANVLRVPTTAVLGSGKDRYVYVSADKEVRERKVAVGLAGDGMVEIVDGLKEGDVVLRNPADLALKLPSLK